MKKLIVLCLAAMLCANISFTCWFEDTDAHYPFFNIEAISDPTMILFVDYEAGLGLGYSEKASYPADANLEDWKKYLGDKTEESDISALVYSMPLSELEKLLKDKAALASAAAKNKLLQRWQKEPALKKAMGKYLVYAKKCEIEAQKGADYWDENDKKDKTAIKKLMEEGKSAYDKEKIKFFKDRYAFQVIRAAFYAEKHEDAVKYFDQYFPKGSPESYISFRALELKAGSQRIMGEPESAANYARVFVHCPDRRDVCLNSFSFTNSDDWNNALKYCKNNEEKAAFYAMRGLQLNASMIEELEQMSALVPESPLMEMLTARYISKLQKQAFPRYAESAGTFPQNDIADSEDVKRLKTLMKKMSENSNLKNRDFWFLADAYSAIMLKDIKTANTALASVKAGSAYAEQARILAFVAKLVNIEKLDAATADKLWTELNANEQLKKHEDLNEFFRDVFSLHYLNQGDKARAYLTYHELYSMRGRLDIGLLDALEVFFANASADNKYDSFLVEGRCGSLPDALNVLNELKGVYYLQRNMLDQAITYLSKCDLQHQKNSQYFSSDFLNKTIWHESVTHPYFEVELESQTVNFLYKKYPELDQTYNLLTYAQMLKTLEQKAAKDPAKAAEYNYLLGLAWYNTGVQGWHRPALYYSTENGGNYAWWSADNKMEEIKFYKSYDWISDRFYTADIAAKYFENAISTAKDRELLAKAYYMLAKVEKTRDLSQISDYWNDNPQYSKRYNECFKTLKKELSDTKYYQEVLRECYDFRNAE